MGILKNEKIKKIIMLIVSFVSGILAFICGKLLLNKRNTTDKDRDRIDECQDRAEQQQSNNMSAVAGIEGAIGIIQEIREKQKISKTNCNCDKCNCCNRNDDIIIE